jgi:hypothetical protein
MLEVSGADPVETGDGNFALYMMCSPAEAVSAMVPDDRAALAELRKSAPQGRRMRSAANAAAGAQPGFRAAAHRDAPIREALEMSALPDDAPP